MSDELTATLIRTLERVETKIDVLVEGQHAHDLRFVPLEADLSRRQLAARARRKWVAGVAATLTAAIVLFIFGVHR